MAVNSSTNTDTTHSNGWVTVKIRNGVIQSINLLIGTWSGFVSNSGDLRKLGEACIEMADVLDGK